MAESNEAELDAKRVAIEALDAEILSLVRKRISIVEEIGRIKHETRTPLRNFGVEERVKDRLRGLCRELGVQESLGEDLALFLIRKAVEVQSPIVDAVYAGDHMKVLVVGGLGGMGKWISRFLHIQGHEVRVHDTSSGESLFQRAMTLEAGVADADLIVLAVPMSSCPDVLRAVVGCRPRGIVTEICSLKSHLEPALAEAREAGVRVVSFHPMFGPEARLLTGKQIALCRADNPEGEAVVRGLFSDTSAQLIELPFDRHDHYMGAVLGMAHLVNLGFAGALSHFGIPFPELMQVASVTFLKQIITTHEVIRENPKLYYEIQRMNPSTTPVLESLIASFQRLQATIESGDGEGFAEMIAESRTYFGEATAPSRSQMWEVTG